MKSSELAYIGDAVYELFIRKKIVEGGAGTVDAMNRKAIGYVRAESQALVAKTLLASDFLTQEETEVVKKARNHKYQNRSRSASPVEYKLATGFEALLGFCYINGRLDRLGEIMERAVAIIEAE